MVKNQEGCQNKDPVKDTVATKGIHVSIQMGLVRIMEKEEGMVVHREKERRVFCNTPQTQGSDSAGLFSSSVDQ